tara:strand:- start:725 stop:1096 length:372 start_codon:yes stop_codon:yes gene_type:complete
MNYEKLQNKLNKLSNDLKSEEIKLNNSIEKTFLSNDPNSYQLLNLIQENNKHYLLMKKKYKTLIQQFSIPYLELSDWYVGEDLSYQDYCKIFNKNKTYLDSKKDIQELYSLFLFYSMFSLYFN